MDNLAYKPGDTITLSRRLSLKERILTRIYQGKWPPKRVPQSYVVESFTPTPQPQSQSTP